MEPDKAFYVKWYGPFSSKNRLAEWERQQDWKINLYLLQGKKKYAKKISYYCGKTIRAAYKRFSDADHHIKDIENRDHSIYVGRIANFSTLEEKDILLVEKLLTSYLGWYIGQDSMLNKTNFYAPNCTQEVCIVNRWINLRTGREYQRLPIYSPAHFIPDVMVYHYDEQEKKCELVIASRLKSIWV